MLAHVHTILTQAQGSKGSGFVARILILLEELDVYLVSYNVENFYYLARATLVKDERHIDHFDQIFSLYFRGI